jgi:hypothetical protein
MVLSALESTELALESGLTHEQIIISCKVSKPQNLIRVYRNLARRTEQPLHLGLTEAGMGMKGAIWSATAMGILLNEGIGDTIRISLTPAPGGDRREEVYASCELLQALGVCTQRDRLPRLRPYHQHHVSGIGGTCTGIHTRHHARMEIEVRGRRNHDHGGDGLHRKWTGRIEGLEYRH